MSARGLLEETLPNSLIGKLDDYGVNIDNPNVALGIVLAVEDTRRRFDRRDAEETPPTIGLDRFDSGPVVILRNMYMESFIAQRKRALFTGWVGIVILSVFLVLRFDSFIDSVTFLIDNWDTIHFAGISAYALPFQVPPAEPPQVPVDIPQFPQERTVVRASFVFPIFCMSYTC
jgi:hypothetical protein